MVSQKLFPIKDGRGKHDLGQLLLARANSSESTPPPLREAGEGTEGI
jgi:hypothetical protein